MSDARGENLDIQFIGIVKEKIVITVFSNCNSTFIWKNIWNLKLFSFLPSTISLNVRLSLRLTRKGWFPGSSRSSNSFASSLGKPCWTCLCIDRKGEAQFLSLICLFTRECHSSDRFCTHFYYLAFCFLFVFLYLLFHISTTLCEVS